MDNMVNLKLSKKEKKDTAPTAVNEYKGPDYPWGLEITLEDSTLTKMGVNIGDYDVGEKVTLHAVCEVTRLSQTQRQNDKDRSMCLQITDLSLNGDMADDDDSDEELEWSDSRSKAARKLKKKGY